MNGKFSEKRSPESGKGCSKYCKIFSPWIKK